MKKILMSVSTIAAIALVVTAASGAFFTDTSTSTTATLSSGTLALDVNNNGSADTFTWNLGDMVLAPGESTNPVSITIKNTGDMDLAWFGYFNLTGANADLMSEAIYIKEATMEFLNPDTDAWEPTDHFISNGVGSGPAAAYYNALAASNPFGVITLKSWNNDNAMGSGGGVQMGAIKPGGYAYRLTLQFGMAPLAGNTYQGKSLTLSYTVDATQVNAGALDALFNANSRLTGVGSNHLDWLNDQLDKQGTIHVSL